MDLESERSKLKKDFLDLDFVDLGCCVLLGHGLAKSSTEQQYSDRNYAMIIAFLFCTHLKSGILILHHKACRKKKTAQQK